MHFEANLKIWKTVGLSLRKRADILFLLCILGLPIPAYAFSLSSLSIGTGNDWYTMGLGYNQDDGHSFGAYASATFDNGLILKSEIKGFTDRLESSHRHDELHISASYPFLFEVSPQIGISLVGSAAVVLAGDLDLQNIQNSFHSLIGRDPINLVYHQDRFTIHPSLGLSSQIGWLTARTLMGLELGLSYAHLWEQTLQANIFLAYGSLITVRLGYIARNIEGSDPSQVIQEERYEGLRLAFTYDGLLFQTSFSSFLQSGFSYGAFALNPLALYKPKTYRETDFTFTAGILYNTQGHQNRLVAFSFGPISLETRHTNGPMLNRWEDQNDRMNLGSWLIGYRFFFTRDATLFNPYAKVLAGLKRFNLQQNYTTTVVEEIRPAIAIETGIRIGTEDWWVIGNTSYHPRFAVSLHYVFGTDSIRENPAIGDFEPHTGPWVLMAGIVLDIDHDLT